MDNSVNYLVDTKRGKETYMRYVYDIIYYQREEELDAFGEYIPGMPNVVLDAKTKALMWLQTLLQDEKSREAMIMTSSELCVEELDDVIMLFEQAHNEDSSIDVVYDRLLEVMFDFLEGC
jgi:hypothetical protein